MNMIDVRNLMRAAHTIAKAAERRGELVRQPCEVCGAVKVEGHHDDYTKPLAIRWLCHKHHGEAHKLARAANVVDIEYAAVPKLTCLRCGYSWIQRTAEVPRTCAKCRSAWWNTPRRMNRFGKPAYKKEKP